LRHVSRVSPAGPVRKSAFKSAALLAPVLLLLEFQGTSEGQATKFTSEELKSLPRVCHAQKFINGWLGQPIVPEAERALWAARLGEKDYSHFHHYCTALIYTRRGHAADVPVKRFGNYKAAVENYEYVQRMASRQFPLMPEVSLRKGQVFLLLGNSGAAAAEFLFAIQLKPDYTPAYSALADVHVSLGSLDEALQILDQGLANAPNSALLQQKKAEIESQRSKASH
jgi:tetratricopeptide (TPR) repeat protein